MGNIVFFLSVQSMLNTSLLSILKSVEEMDKGYYFGSAAVMQCSSPASVKVLYHSSAGSEIRARSRVRLEEAGWALFLLITGAGLVGLGACEPWAWK